MSPSGKGGGRHAEAEPLGWAGEEPRPAGKPALQSFRTSLGSSPRPAVPRTPEFFRLPPPQAPTQILGF